MRWGHDDKASEMVWSSCHVSQGEAPVARTPSVLAKSMQLMMAKAGQELGLLTVLGVSKFSPLLSLCDWNFSNFYLHPRLAEILVLTGSLYLL